MKEIMTAMPVSLLNSAMFTIKVFPDYRAVTAGFEVVEVKQ